MSNVIELILSLEKSEKRYFSLQSKLQDGDKKYLELFQKIEELEHPTEDKLIEIFENKSSYYHHKKYLYQQLINSLRTFHSKDIKHRCNAFLEELDILNKKLLYDALGKRIKVAKKFGEHHEQFDFLIAVCHYQHSYLFFGKEQNDTQKVLEVQKEIQLYLEKSQNLSAIQLLEIELKSLLRTIRFARNKKDIDKVQKIRKNKLLQDEKMILSQSAKIKKLDCKITIAKLLGESEEIKINSEKLIEHYEQNTFLSSIDSKIYLSGLFSLLNYLSQHKEVDKMPILFKKIKKHQGKSLSNDIFIFKSITSNELSYLDQQKNPAAMLQYLDKIVKQTKELQPYLQDQAILVNYTNFVLYSIKYDKKIRALEYIKYALSLNIKNVRLDLINVLSLLELVILFELKRYEELEIATSTIYPKLYRNKMNFKPELLVVNFFKKTPFTILSKKDLKEALMDFKAKTIPFNKRKQINNVGFFHYFSIEIWIDEQVQALE